MPKILTYNTPPKIAKERTNQPIFKNFYDWFSSLDKFIRLYLIFIVLVSIVTLAIVSGYLIFNPHAATPALIPPWSSTPNNTSPTQTGGLARPLGLTTYTVDREVIDEVNLINNYRSQNGLATLATDRMLTEAAKWMASDMANKNYFSHTDSLGRDPFARMANFGYGFNTWKGENLVMGTVDPVVAFDTWKNSPGHNAIMLSPNYIAIGLYRAYNPNLTNGYWVADFGGYIDEQVNYVTPQPTPTLTPTPIPISQPSANITASPNPCLIPSTGTSCGTTVSWSTTGYTGTIYLCVSDGTSTTKVGEGLLGGPSNQTLSWGKSYTYKLLLNPSDCNSGTQIQSLMVNVYKINTQGGDVNCDGSVDSVDALLILKSSAHISISGTNCAAPSGGFNASVADFLVDGHIDSLDALFILRKVAGLLNMTPVQFTSAYKDSDRDLMTNSEESAYSCLSNSIQDSKIDFDKDGLTNLDEITRGTNPCISDTDRDGFNDGLEVFLGTNPKSACGVNAWPPDLNNDKQVTLTDVLMFNPVMNTVRGDGKYNQRFDLNTEYGKITTDDLLPVKKYYLKSCY